MHYSTTFNSTRYIRNLYPTQTDARLGKLSTPHGTLGTGFCTHKRGIYPTILSTPHGTLGTLKEEEKVPVYDLKLSTPHGTLGTGGSAVYSKKKV